MIGKLAAVLALAAVAASPAAAQTSYAGKWASNGLECLLDQSVPGAPLLLQASRYDQHEAHCSFSSVRKSGPGSWQVRATCSVEGDRQRHRFTMSVAGDTLTIRDRRGARTLLRC